jgi:hypothetical protein
MVIDLGEPDRYDPRPPPLLGRRARFAVRVRRKQALAAAAILIAGALAGATPATAALPQVIQVGRFTENPLSIVAGELVLSVSDDQRTLTASAIDGSGTRWQRTLPAGTVGAMGTVGQVVLISLYSMTIGPGAVPEVQMFTVATLAIDARTGMELWRRDAAPLTPLGEPSTLVLQTGSGPGPSDLVGVEPATGREVWRRAVPAGGEVAVVEQAGARSLEELLIVVAGTVQPVWIASGDAGGVERIGAPGPVLFAWEDLVVRQVGRTAAAGEVAVYRRGQTTPLWSREYPTEFILSPCGQSFCSGTSDERLDPYTGVATATAEPSAAGDQFRRAAALGKWEPIGEHAGRILVRLDPSWTADAKTWLGVVVPKGKTYHVHPLMPFGGRSNSCMLTEEWLYCSGSAVTDAVSVRLSELDVMLAEVGGPA